jgi:Transglutaminase-like superfamily
MTDIDRYARHSPYTDPGQYRQLLAAVPTDLPGLSAVIRNVLVHYRSGVELSAERLTEIDNRWVDRILATDQGRHPVPLAQPRANEQRVAGCCRDFTLLGVAALREHGLVARSRIGFAGYFVSDFWVDHVIAEVWRGDRWVFADLQLDPADEQWGFDVQDMPLRVGSAPDPAPVFATAAQVWTGYRRGELDPERYGVGPDVPIGGPWFIRNYVLHELAHRQGEELLLWDAWGDGTRATVEGTDVELIDEVAALLLAADDGDAAAEAQLTHRYRTDPKLHPDGTVLCISPRGDTQPVVATVDLTTRTATPVDSPEVLAALQPDS